MAAGVPAYSKRLHRVIVENVRKGHPKTIAFREVGIHPDTVWRWLEQGRIDPKRYPQYVQLAEDLDQAKALADADALDRIQAAAKSDPKHWTADAWYLERTSPQHFSKRDKVDVEIDAPRPLVQFNQLVLQDPNARESARALLRKVTGLESRAPLELDHSHEDEQ
jgi:hypothetical protein